MALLANTHTSYEAPAIREDLSDAIYNISPKTTPFMSNGGRGEAKQSLFEWQTDELAAPNTANAVLEGDDVDSFDAIDTASRRANVCQISRKTAIVSGSNEASLHAGVSGVMSYHMAKKAAELKRDVESILLSNQGAVPGDNAEIRKTGSLTAFVRTNTTFGVGGANPPDQFVPLTARTDGTQAPFTEQMVKDVMAAAYDAGGEPDILSVGTFNKQVASTFDGIAQTRVNTTTADATVIIGAADIYVSDFGNLAIVPNRFQRPRDAWYLDSNFYSVAYLRPFFSKPLAVNGDNEKRLLLVEYGLKVNNEAALGGSFDLTTSV